MVLLSVVGIVTATCGQQKQGDMTEGQSNNKVLVAYFSATGTTARAAEKLADVTGGELYAIAPAQPYTGADLDWNDKRSRSSVEMNDSNARPALKGEKKNIADYDVVFIGYPIWWDLAPRIINTFCSTTPTRNPSVHGLTSWIRPGASRAQEAYSPNSRSRAHRMTLAGGRSAASSSFIKSI